MLDRDKVKLLIKKKTYISSQIQQDVNDELSWKYIIYNIITDLYENRNMKYTSTKNNKLIIRKVLRKFQKRINWAENIEIERDDRTKIKT